MRAYIRGKISALDGWAIGPSIEDLLDSVLSGHSIADADAVIQKAIDSAAVRRLRESTSDIRESDVEHAAKLVLRAPAGSF